MLKFIQLFVVVMGIAMPATIGWADPPQTQPAHKESEDRTVDGGGFARRLPEVTFDGVGFSDAIDFMRDISGANIVIDGKRLEGAGIDKNTPISMKLHNVKFDAALGAICDTAGKNKLVFGIHQGIIIISTKEGLDLLSSALNQDISAWDEKTKKAMSQRVPMVSCDGVAVSDAVDFIRDAGHVKIEVDWENLKKSSGLEKSSPVSLKLKFATVGDAIHLIFQTAADKPIQITNSQGVLKSGLRQKPRIQWWKKRRNELRFAKKVKSMKTLFALIGLLSLAITPQAFAESPATAPTGDAQRAKAAHLVLALGREVPGREINAQPIEKVFAEFADAADAPESDLFVDWRGLEANGIDPYTPVTVKLETGPLISQLDAVLKAINPKVELDWRVSGRILVICEKSSAERFAWFDYLARGPVIAPEINFKGMPISEAVDFVIKCSDVKVEVDWGGIAVAKSKPIPCDVKVHGLHTSTILSLLFAAVDENARVFEEKDNFFVSTIERRATRAMLARQLPEFTFEAVPLVDCVGFLHDVSGLKIDVDWDTFSREKIDRSMPVSGKYRNVTLREGLSRTFEAVTKTPVQITITKTGVTISPTTKPAK